LNPIDEKRKTESRRISTVNDDTMIVYINMCVIYLVIFTHIANENNTLIKHIPRRAISGTLLKVPKKVFLPGYSTGILDESKEYNEKENTDN